MQQLVYQRALGNVYELKKQLVKSRLIWSRTLLTLLSLRAEIVSVPAFAQWVDISSSFIAGSLIKNS